MLVREFAPRRIGALRPAVDRTAAALLDDLTRPPQPTDLVGTYALPLPSIVIAALLGVPYADHEFFEDRARVMMDDSASGDANRAATADLARYLGTLLQQRRTEPTPTTCTAGSAPSRSSRGTLRGEAASMAVLLLVAGHETTANQIALSVAFRLENPQHAEALRRRKARPPEPSTSCCGC